MTLQSTLNGSDAKRAARNVTALMVASLISKGALFVWQLILAPWLGTFTYGIYGTVGALIAVSGSISSFSMGLIVIRDVAREPHKAGKYWSAIMVLQTVLVLDRLYRNEWFCSWLQRYRSCVYGSGRHQLIRRISSAIWVMTC